MRRCPSCGYRLSARKTRARTKATYRREGHEYLVGVLAHTMRRLQIFRNAGGEADWFDEDDPSTVQEIRPATCQGCVEPHLIGWDEGQWHHNVKTKGGKRCDCAACGMFVCPMVHEFYRNKVIPVIERNPHGI
jgi:hypothetical protein